MQHLQQLRLIALAVLLACPSARGDDTSLAVVSGLVSLKGKVPAAEVVKLKEDMRAVTAAETLLIQPWQVSEKKGVANCVVTLTPQEKEKRTKPQPAKEIRLEKVGAQFVPRVLVAPVGSTVLYRNRNSPCKCFRVSGRSQSINQMVPIGEPFELKLGKRRDLLSIQSNLRPYMQGWIYVTDTPYFALTDREGKFKISRVPPGEYRLRVWHEAKPVGLKSDLKLQEGEQRELKLTLEAN